MKTAYLTSIELENFRQFSKQIIAFPPMSERNITVIMGYNGYGKSNIFNAITWCLFGEEQHLKPDSKALPLCNTRALKKLKPGHVIEAKVVVNLITEEGAKNIERRLGFSKDKDGQVDFGDSVLTVLEQCGRDWEDSPYPEAVISKLVPKGMNHFFFIDGERLRQTFEKINPEVIKSSIFDLSQISLLQRAYEHLDSVKDSFRKEVKGANPDLDRHSDRLDQIRTEIQHNNAILRIKEREKNEAKENKNRLDKELENMQVAVLTEKSERRRILEQNIALHQNSLDDSKLKFFQYLCSIAHFVMAYPDLCEVHAKIRQMESEHKLPPKIEAAFLTELLTDGSCICGTKLEPSSKAMKKLRGLLEDAKYSSVAKDNIELKCHLADIMRECSQFEGNCELHEKSIRTEEQRLSVDQKELKIIEDQIKGIDIEKVQKKNKERTDYDTALHQVLEEIGKLKQSIRQQEQLQKELEELITKEIKKDAKNEEIAKRIEFCQQGMNALETIREKIMMEIKNEIEKKTKDYWKSIVTAKDFATLAITDNYELMIEKDGYNAVTSLSAAETLCLGYSFMAALRHASGFSVPIVIDTPLAKIDTIYRKNVADWFKTALPNAQLVLLVTDSEYTSEFRKEIQKSVAKAYELKFDPNTETSEVVEWTK